MKSPLKVHFPNSCFPYVILYQIISVANKFHLGLCLQINISMCELIYYEQEESMAFVISKHFFISLVYRRPQNEHELKHSL